MKKQLDLNNSKYSIAGEERFSSRERNFILGSIRPMNLRTLVHAPEASKEVVKRLTEKNIGGKLDQYLKKFEKSDAEGTIEIKIDTNKKGKFDGALIARLDSQNYHYRREDYNNLDDLVNNLFDHLKEGLSK